jgi:hypothetical protein
MKSGFMDIWKGLCRYKERLCLYILIICLWSKARKAFLKDAVGARRHFNNDAAS